MKLRRIPHCASAYHLAVCTCKHTRMLHENEEGVCKELDCGCNKFDLAPNYPHIEHEIIR